MHKHRQGLWGQDKCAEVSQRVKQAQASRSHKRTQHIHNSATDQGGNEAEACESGQRAKPNERGHDQDGSARGLGSANEEQLGGGGERGVTQNADLAGAAVATHKALGGVDLQRVRHLGRQLAQVRVPVGEPCRG